MYCTFLSRPFPYLVFLKHDELKLYTEAAFSSDVGPHLTSTILANLCNCGNAQLQGSDLTNSLRVVPALQVLPRWCGTGIGGSCFDTFSIGHQ